MVHRLNPQITEVFLIVRLKKQQEEDKSSK